VLIKDFIQQLFLLIQYREVRELMRELLEHDPNGNIIFDNDHYSLFEIDHANLIDVTELSDKKDVQDDAYILMIHNAKS
jgi:hypothetical protein